MKTAQISIAQGSERIFTATVVLLAGLLMVLSAPRAAWAQQPVGSIYFLNRAKSADAAGYIDRYGSFHQTRDHFAGSTFLGVTHLVNTDNAVLAYNSATGVATAVQLREDGSWSYSTRSGLINT
jgi:hypothetical protein